MNQRRIRILLMIIVLLPGPLALTAGAAFTGSQAREHPCMVMATATWDEAASAVNPYADAGLQDWNLSLMGTLPTPASPSLDVSVQHLKGCGAQAPGSDWSQSVSLPTSYTLRMAHHFHAKGEDYFLFYVASEPGPRSTSIDHIGISAEHRSQPAHLDPYTYSYIHRGHQPMRIRFRGRYRDAEGKTFHSNWSEEEVVQPGLPNAVEHEAPRHEVDGEEIALTGIQIEGLSSPKTSTTVAFLGYIDGDPQLAELELGFLTEMSGEEFDNGAFRIEAPLLRQTDPIINLYVFVDLGLWLSGGGGADGGEQVRMMAGRSPDLPGIYVSEDAIELSDAGPSSHRPYSGMLAVEGIIGGEARPPTKEFPIAAVVLLAAALLATLLALRNR